MPSWEADPAYKTQLEKHNPHPKMRQKGVPKTSSDSKQTKDKTRKAEQTHKTFKKSNREGVVQAPPGRGVEALLGPLLGLGCLAV